MDKSAHNDKTETLNSNQVAHVEHRMLSICQLLLHNYGHLLFSDVTEGVLSEQGRHSHLSFSCAKVYAWGGAVVVVHRT